MSLDLIQVVLIASIGYRALSAALLRFNHFENVFSFWLIFLIRVVNQVWIQFCQLFKFHESTLVPKSLLS